MNLDKIPDFSITKNCKIGKGTVIYPHTNLYGCLIGENCKIDAFVYIEEGVTMGDNCKVRPFTFIPTGVIIGNNVFIGPNVTFTNDLYPKVSGQWELKKTIIRDNVSIGAGAVILSGIEIGDSSFVGAGSVVTKSVPPNTIVYGNPAKPKGVI